MAEGDGESIADRIAQGREIELIKWHEILDGWKSFGRHDIDIMQEEANEAMTAIVQEIKRVYKEWGYLNFERKEFTDVAQDIFIKFLENYDPEEEGEATPAGFIRKVRKDGKTWAEWKIIEILKQQDKYKQEVSDMVEMPDGKRVPVSSMTATPTGGSTTWNQETPQQAYYDKSTQGAADLSNSYYTIRKRWDFEALLREMQKTKFALTSEEKKALDLTYNELANVIHIDRCENFSDCEVRDKVEKDCGKERCLWFDYWKGALGHEVSGTANPWRKGRHLWEAITFKIRAYLYEQEKQINICEVDDQDILELLQLNEPPLNMTLSDVRKMRKRIGL